MLDGTIVADAARRTATIEEYIGEAIEPRTYLKSAYYKPLGYPDGMYRVGPLARLNIVERCGTPLADEELAEFRELQRGPGAELVLLPLRPADRDPVRCRAHRAAAARSGDARARTCAPWRMPNSLEGVGVAEAPRGTLLHHYRIDENGLITWANLIIATGHNNLAMNRGCSRSPSTYVTGTTIDEGMLNRVEAVIRTFDPCLSCSTHAFGQMPLQVEVLAADGTLLDRVRRD